MRPTVTSSAEKEQKLACEIKAAYKPKRQAPRSRSFGERTRESVNRSPVIPLFFR